jgi:hypothetical protein
MKKYPNINSRAIIKRHNRWRRGAEIPQEDPKMLGDAIELICLEHAEMERELTKIAKTTPIHSEQASGMMRSALRCLEKIKHRKGRHASR